MSIAVQHIGAARRLLVLAITVVGAIVIQASAGAHELRPAIVTAEIERSGKIELRIALNLEAQIAGIGPEHTNTSQSDKAPTYDRLRRATPEALRAALEPLAADLLG